VQRGNLKSLPEPRCQQNLSANPKTGSEIILAQPTYPNRQVCNTRFLAKTSTELATDLELLLQIHSQIKSP
jgi:hypothetical protein